MRYAKSHFNQRYIRIVFIIIVLSITSVSFAQDKVVVIPLFDKTSPAGQSCSAGSILIGFDSNGDIICETQKKYIFVTSGVFDGDFGGAGIINAHKACQAEADAAALGGMYHAWLSDDSSYPDISMIKSQYQYILPTGEVVANGWLDLVDASLQHAIDTSADGVVYTSGVWTATNVHGMPFNPGNNCGNWRSNSASDFASLGRSWQTNLEWVWFTSDSCDEFHRIYCIQQ